MIKYRGKRIELSCRYVWWTYRVNVPGTNFSQVEPPGAIFLISLSSYDDASLCEKTAFTCTYATLHVVPEKEPDHVTYNSTVLTKLSTVTCNVTYCSEAYQSTLNNNSTTLEWYDYILDFLQGTVTMRIDTCSHAADHFLPQGVAMAAIPIRITVSSKIVYGCDCAAFFLVNARMSQTAKVTLYGVFMSVNTNTACSWKDVKIIACNQNVFLPDYFQYNGIRRRIAPNMWKISVSAIFRWKWQQKSSVLLCGFALKLVCFMYELFVITQRCTQTPCLLLRVNNDYEILRAQ